MRHRALLPQDDKDQLVLVELDPSESVSQVVVGLATIWALCMEARNASLLN